MPVGTALGRPGLTVRAVAPFRQRGPKFWLDQAARTVARKCSTSVLSLPLSCDSDCAEERTCEEAEPVCAAPPFTSVMLLATWVVPCAACCTLRAISAV